MLVIELVGGGGDLHFFSDIKTISVKLPMALEGRWFIVSRVFNLTS